MRQASGFCIAGLAILLAHEAAADCKEQTDRLAKLTAAGDLSAAAQLTIEIADAAECDSKEVSSAKSRLAQAYLDRAEILRPTPGQERAADAMVEAAANQHVLWSASVAWGDVQARKQAWAGAAAAYQEAINLIDEIDTRKLDENAKLSLRQETERLRRLAGEVRHLAATAPQGTLVAALPTKAGNPGGVYVGLGMRGAEALKLPVPILFAFDSDKFIPVGQAAADELVEILTMNAPNTIVVTGHTDQRGTDEYNRQLSLRRATAVATHLKSKGIAARIEIKGKGELEPRVISNPGAYTAEQIAELNRRVEFDWR